MIFTMMKFLILGKDEQDLAPFIKAQSYAEVVHAVKTCKLKQNAYRQTVKNFLFKTGLYESVDDYEYAIMEKKQIDDINNNSESVPQKTNTAKHDMQSNASVKKPAIRSIASDKKSNDVQPNSGKISSNDQKKPVISNDKNVKSAKTEDLDDSLSYRDLADKDKNIKLAVDILKWLGFSNDILDNSSVKMELRHAVRARVKRVMCTPEAKRVKMLWPYELEKKLKESQWTDDTVDEDEDLTIADLKKPSIVSKKFELPDSINYKPWKFSIDDSNNVSFNNGKLSIEFDDESFDKIVKSINDEKKAFVVKDTSDIKWVFTQNEIGGLFVVQQGKTDKMFLTPLDVENMLK